MKRILFPLLLLTVFAFAQDGNAPADWTHSVEPLGEDRFRLTFAADIAEGWHMYSQFTAEGGSLPSVFTYPEEGEGYRRLGETRESAVVKEFNEVFGVEETFFEHRAVFTQDIERIDPGLRQLEVELFYQICEAVCIPMEIRFEITLDGGEFVAVDQGVLSDDDLDKGEALRLPLKRPERLQSQANGAKESTPTNGAHLFGLGFLGGLIALLTPCVFPLIPLTVSFFTKREGPKGKGIRDALLYSVFIVLIYLLLSLPFHLFGQVDPQILNTLATDVTLNLVFFLVFVAFALSFFGYYEINLPNSWANRLDGASRRFTGGLGIFFMALTLAIVSFSCTGPILGGLLGGTALAEGDVATNLSWGMTGFGTALALPFGAFALFPRALDRLPRSGAWMDTVKVTLGFLELALALKFLSNADLVGNWGFLKRELFLGIWALVFLGTALYGFGILRFPHTPKGRPGPVRSGLGILGLFAALYLVLGMFGKADLRLLSGFPPPDFYTLAPQTSDCPLGLDCHKDFETGRAAAEASGRPILLDFTGWACVNCRKMEEQVWSDPEVFALLDGSFTLVSLYVDDRRSLPDEDRFELELDNGARKSIRTVGQKWGTFQLLNFKNASQPYYVMLAPNLEVLGPPVQYTDVATYRAWLRSGLERFKARSDAAPFAPATGVPNPFGSAVAPVGDRP